MKDFGSPIFHEKFVQHSKFYVENPHLIYEQSHLGINSPDNYKFILSHMENPRNARVLFDARQCAIFDKSEPLEAEGFKIKPIFQNMTIAFTEPVEIQAQEPGFPNDKLILIIYLHNYSEVPVLTEQGIQKIPASMAIFVFWNDERSQFTDRCFRLSLDNKLAFPAVQNVRHTNDPSEIPKDWNDLQWFVSGMKIRGMEDRHIGFWEKSSQSWTNLLIYLFQYAMSKSVRIEEQRISRQQRRYLERKNQIPIPWRLVTLEPKFYYKYVKGESTGERSKPSYSYSITGHLRVNKHKLRDGSYRNTIEWVSDYIKNKEAGIFIPKTYQIKGKKNILPEMKEYFE